MDLFQFDPPSGNSSASDEEDRQETKARLRRSLSDGEEVVQLKVKMQRSCQLPLVVHTSGNSRNLKTIESCLLQPNGNSREPVCVCVCVCVPARSFISEISTKCIFAFATRLNCQL